MDTYIQVIVIANTMISLEKCFKQYIAYEHTCYL